MLSTSPPDQTLPLISRHHPDMSLSRALNAAEQIAQRLRSLSISGGPSALSTQFYTRVRVKSRESIRGKVARNLRFPKTPPSYSFADLDDLVGFRLVTLYDDDLVNGDDGNLKSAAMTYIIDLVKAGQQSSQPLFRTGLIWGDDIFVRGKFFRRPKPATDVYTRCNRWLRNHIHDECTALGFSSVEHQRRCRVTNPSAAEHEYSSGHLTFIAHAYTNEYRTEIPVEFQFRTVSEDLWSEINHKLLYKIENPNAWSPAFVHHRDLAHSESRELKETVDYLPLLVAKLLTHSTNAQRAIQKFKIAPDSFYHFSLAVSLFWAIDTQHISDLRKPFDTYETLINRLLNTTRDTDAAQLLSDAITQVTSIASTIKSFRKTETDHTELECLRQQLLLCEFEILRLTTLMVIQYNHKPRGSSFVPLSKEQNSLDNRQLYISLYGRFCRFKDNKTLKLRPLSVILFWKYLLSKQFDLATAKLNLLDAYEELTFDPCVPEWTVYKMLIPRHLAIMLSAEAMATFETVNSALPGEAVKMVGLAKEIKKKLIDALRYALAAFMIPVDKSGRTGDLTFSPKKRDDAIRDANQILNIYLFYVTAFNENVTNRTGIDIKELRKVVDHVKVEPLDGIISEAEQEELRRNLVATEHWLDIEQQRLRAKGVSYGKEVNSDSDTAAKTRYRKSAETATSSSKREDYADTRTDNEKDNGVSGEHTHIVP
jgi:ppGpp synthetase/RelA/SpoT-type nucleotidyltranferase